MKKNVLAIALLALLGGCSVERPASDAAPAPAAETAAAQPGAEPSATGPAQCPPAFYSPLPDPSIVFAFPFHVARDRVYTTDAGETRRGLTLEYIEGTEASTWEAIVSSLEAAGFSRAGDVTDAPKGTFSKPGFPSIYAEVTHGAVEAPTNPATQGSIWISWRTE